MSKKERPVHHLESFVSGIGTEHLEESVGVRRDVCF